jgi:hypothetical protein
VSRRLESIYTLQGKNLTDMLYVWPRGLTYDNRL